VVLVGSIWDPFRSHLLVDTDPFRFFHHLQHINAYDATADEILEDVIHHGLEGSWAVSHTIQHYRWLKEPSVAPKGHLPFVAFLDLDVLVAPSDIKFGVFCTA
jgi:hypothetical protein